VFEWDASSHGYAWELWKKAILSDGGLGCQRLCDMSGEPLIEGMLVGTSKDLLTTEQTHQVCSRSLSTLSRYTSNLNPPMKLLADIDDYRKEYLRQWLDSGVDAVISPVTPWVGYKPWTWVKSRQYIGYTTLCNLLDWAGLVIPVTTVCKDAGDKTPPEEWTSHEPRNESDEFNKRQCECPRTIRRCLRKID
jgi:amidase